MSNKRFTLLVLAMLVPACALAAATAKPARARHHKVAAAMHPSVSADSARAIATARLPGATVKSEELEREHGHLIYSYDMVVPGKSGIDEVNVDAMTGKVLNVSHEGPKKEAREHRQEAREASKDSTGH